MNTQEDAARIMARPTVTREMAALACSEKYTAPVIVSHWTLPAGAFGDSCGPT